MTTRPLRAMLGAFAIATTLSGSAVAQPLGPGDPGSGPGWGMGPGRMMGPGMMGSADYRRLCHPGMMGLSAWRIEDIGRRIQLDATQTKALDALKSASAKAEETMRAACPGEVPTSAPDRLAVMEKRMDAMLQSIRILRPAYDEFYKTLTDEQKARFDRAGPRRWPGPWWSGRNPS